MTTASDPSAQTFSVDQLRIRLFPNRQLLGQDAAQTTGATIRKLQRVRPVVNIIFASAPSQNEFLEGLAAETGIDWRRVRAFHMDEYVGLSTDAPQSFGCFLRERLFDKVGMGDVFYINGQADDPQQECDRYASLLTQYPADIVCMGIGENCHIAFNDPHVADFNDSRAVKLVQLDLTSRQQQVHDGCFAIINAVPEYALTLTIPALVRAAHVFCMVPAATKAEAVRRTLLAPVSETYPSTILRTHPDATLFIDQNSAGQYLQRN